MHGTSYHVAYFVDSLTAEIVKDCSVGWLSFSFTGYVCGVDELVAGWVGVSTTHDCNTVQGMQNPAIWFSDASQISETTLVFNQLRPGVIWVLFPCPQDHCV